MREFKSWHSYSQFTHSVKINNRYIYDDSIRDFLETVVKTGKSREIIVKVKERGVLWRAQLGCDRRPIKDEYGDIIEEEEYPYKIERMFPEKNKAKEGRVNPRGIPYLYLSNDRDTAMAEIRPWKEMFVSVCLFKLKKDLKLIDCSRDNKRHHFYREEPAPEIREQCVWADINEAFSRPVAEDDKVAEYVPTQIIAEVFKNRGYDGIVYKSSYGEGHNIALFEIEFIEPISCHVFKTKEIAFKFEDTPGNYWIKKKNDSSN